MSLSVLLSNPIRADRNGRAVTISKGTGAVRFSSPVYCDRDMPDWWEPATGSTQTFGRGALDADKAVRS